MPQIVTRTLGPTAKGALLTNAEVDTNFININTAIDNLYLSKIQPSLSVDWTKKPTASALTSAGWTISRAGEITSFGLPTKAAENLFVRSQDFGNAAWYLKDAALSSVTGPGGLVGTKIVANNSNATHGLNQDATSRNIGLSSYRVRFLCRASEYSKCLISDGLGGRVGSAFDLATGSIIGTGFGAGYISHSITPHEFGGGLYWCELVMTSAAAGAAWGPRLGGYPDIGSTLNEVGASYTGDGVSGIEVYAAQLQQGFDGDYIPTTTDPITLYEPQLVTTAANELAYQHNESGECIGLVQYPGDTNLILQSQDLGHASWGKGAVSVTASKRRWAGSVPFWRLAKTDTVPSRSISQPITTSIAAGAKYSVTIAVMADRWGGTTSVGIGVSGTANGLWGAAGDSTATIISGPGSITQANGSLHNITGLSTTVPTLVRITRTYPLADTSTGIFIYPDASNSTTLGAAILATRVHLSASPRLMPYIPTTTAAVTRGAQSITFGGSAFSAVNNPKEGTLLAKVVREDPVNNATKVYARMDVGSVFDGFSISLTTGVNTGNAGGAVSNASSAQAELSVTVPVSASPIVFANSYAQNSFQTAANGQLSAVDTSGIVPRVTTLRLSVGGGFNSDPDGYYQRTELYPRAMTSSELAAITTPGVL